MPTPPIRGFNVAGPCFAHEHYMIPVARRAAAFVRLLEEGRWFSLVSGRQTGKTTVVQSLADSLTARGERLVLWVDLETARGRPDPAVALRSVLEAITTSLEQAERVELAPSPTAVAAWLAHPDTALLHYLRALCAASERPVVLLFDEADVLCGASVVTFLTQLRALYGCFPSCWSDGLCVDARSLHPPLADSRVFPYSAAGSGRGRETSSRRMVLQGDTGSS